MRRIRNDYDNDVGIWGAENAATAPWVLQSVAKHDIRCGTGNKRTKTNNINRIFCAGTELVILLYFAATVNGGRHVGRWSHAETFETIIGEFLQIPFLHWEHVALVFALAAHRHHHFGTGLENRSR